MHPFSQKFLSKDKHVADFSDQAVIPSFVPAQRLVIPDLNSLPDGNANCAFHSNDYVEYLKPLSYPDSGASSSSSFKPQNYWSQTFLPTTTHMPNLPPNHRSSSDYIFANVDPRYPQEYDYTGCTNFQDSGGGSSKRKNRNASLGFAPLNAGASDIILDASEQPVVGQPCGSRVGNWEGIPFYPDQHIENMNLQPTGGSQRIPESKSTISTSHCNDVLPGRVAGNLGYDTGYSGWSHAPDLPQHLGGYASTGCGTAGNILIPGNGDFFCSRSFPGVQILPSVYQPLAIQPIVGTTTYMGYPFPALDPGRRMAYHHFQPIPVPQFNMHVVPQLVLPDKVSRSQGRDMQVLRTPPHNNQISRSPTPQTPAPSDFSDYYDEDSSDEYGDMRLDVDNMSYEELLDLEERIGCVKTGLSEETILKHMETRELVTCISSRGSVLHKSKTNDGECIICQDEYKDQDIVGLLDCKHDYHADCIKQWLVLKNMCPICRAQGLNSVADNFGG